MNYPILDGHLYNTRLKCDLRFLPIALQQFEALRRSQAYSNRIVTIPEDAGHVAIPNRNVFSYAQRIVPGSAFWAYSFIGPSGTTGMFSVNEKDNCSDESIFSEELINVGNPQIQIPFAKLLVIGSPGLANVQICSLASTDMTGVQFLLWGGEPKF